MITLHPGEEVTILLAENEGKFGRLDSVGWNPEDNEMEIIVRHEPFISTHYFVRDVAITDLDEIRIRVY